MGYGFKATDEHFFPKEPQGLQEEVVDKNEQPEPNFPPEVEENKNEE